MSRQVLLQKALFAGSLENMWKKGGMVGREGKVGGEGEEGGGGGERKYVDKEYQR